MKTKLYFYIFLIFSSLCFAVFVLGDLTSTDQISFPRTPSYSEHKASPIPKSAFSDFLSCYVQIEHTHAAKSRYAIIYDSKQGTTIPAKGVVLAIFSDEKTGFYQLSSENIFFYPTHQSIDGKSFKLNPSKGNSVYIDVKLIKFLNPEKSSSGSIHAGTELFIFQGSASGPSSQSKKNYTEIGGIDALNPKTLLWIKTDLTNRIKQISDLYSRHLSTYNQEISEYKKDPTSYRKKRLQDFIGDMAGYSWNDEYNKINVDEFLKSPAHYLDLKLEIKPSNSLTYLEEGAEGIKEEILSGYKFYLEDKPRPPLLDPFLPTLCTKIEDKLIKKAAQEEIHKLMLMPNPGGSKSTGNK